MHPYNFGVSVNILMKFLYALEINQGNLAHTPTGTGIPLKILIVKIKNLA